MRGVRGMAVMAGGALVAAAALVASASAATDKHAPPARRPQVARSLGGFTPAAGDPRLAALFAKSGMGGEFRFTPAETRPDGRGITVALRARTNRQPIGKVAVADATTTVGLIPDAYNLGASVAWRRFSLSGDLAKVDLGPLPGGREAADVALSYTAPRWSGRVKAIADRPTGGTPRAIADLPSYSVDLGGSYSLTRNLDVTAGVRYRTDRERLARLDDRRDSQAVYVGTAFRF